MAKRRLPARRTSGNPANRPQAARTVAQLSPAQLELAGDLWPYAFDYFDSQDRIGLFADVPIITVDGEPHIDLHGLVQLPITIDLPEGTTRFAMVATFRTPEGRPESQCSVADTFEQALAEILHDTAARFINETGPLGPVYMTDAALQRPMLQDPKASLRMLLPMIHHRPGKPAGS